MRDLTLLSLQIGKAKTYPQEIKKDKIYKSYTTGFGKLPTKKSTMVTLGGLEGDGVSDTKHHGGIDKAIFANAFSNYSKWAEILGIKNLYFGALGENLTIKGLDEKNVHIGDIHSFGEVVLQVSQPRKPCYKISRFWRNPKFTQNIYESGLTGWYYRVLTPGCIKAPCKINIQKIDKARITIFDANKSFRNPEEHKEIYDILTNHEALANTWKVDIMRRYKTCDSSFPAYMQIP